MIKYSLAGPKFEILYASNELFRMAFSYFALSLNFFLCVYGAVSFVTHYRKRAPVYRLNALLYYQTIGEYYRVKQILQLICIIRDSENVISFLLLTRSICNRPFHSMWISIFFIFLLLVPEFDIILHGCHCRFKLLNKISK